MSDFNKIQDITGLNDVANYQQLPYPAKASLTKNNGAIRDLKFVYDTINQLIPYLGGYNFRLTTGVVGNTLTVSLLCLSNNGQPNAQSISSETQQPHNSGDVARILIGNKMVSITGDIALSIVSRYNWLGLSNERTNNTPQLLYVYAGLDTNTDTVFLGVSKSPYLEMCGDAHTDRTKPTFLVTRNRIQSSFPVVLIGKFYATLDNNYWTNAATGEVQSVIGQPPYYAKVSVYSNVRQSVSNSGWADLSFQNVMYDDLDYKQDNNHTSITIKKTGLYNIHGYTKWDDSSATTSKGIYIAINNKVDETKNSVNYYTGTNNIDVIRHLYLKKGDTVGLRVNHNANRMLNVLHTFLYLECASE